MTYVSLCSGIPAAPTVWTLTFAFCGRKQGLRIEAASCDLNPWGVYVFRDVLGGWIAAIDRKVVIEAPVVLTRDEGGMEGAGERNDGGEV